MECSVLVSGFQVIAGISHEILEYLGIPMAPIHPWGDGWWLSHLPFRVNIKRFHANHWHF